MPEVSQDFMDKIASVICDSEDVTRIWRGIEGQTFDDMENAVLKLRFSLDQFYSISKKGAGK